MTRPDQPTPESGPPEDRRYQWLIQLFILIALFIVIAAFTTFILGRLRVLDPR